MPKKPRKPSKPRKLLTPAELVQRRFLKAGIKLTREDIAEQQRLDAMIFERPPSTTHRAETKQHPIITKTPVPVPGPTMISNVATLEPEVKREGGSEDKGSENGVDEGASGERMQGLAESRKKQDTLADLDMAQSGRRRDEDEDQEDVGMVAHQAVPQMPRVHSHKAEEAASSERCERAPKQRENEKYGEEIQHEKPKQQQQVKKGLLDGPRGVKRKKTDGADSGDEVGGALDATLDDAIEGAGEKAEKIKDRKRGDKNAPRMSRHAPGNK